MSARALLLEVRFLNGWYHGVGDWPPSPFRLFQALVAGAYGGRWVAESAAGKDAAFRWLEGLTPPLVAGPSRRPLRATVHYVPNNDLDAVGGDPRRMSEIRARKTVRPQHFDADSPFFYMWSFDEGEKEARLLCALTERLHTLGRGVDAAFARAVVLNAAEAETRVLGHPGTICRPVTGSSQAGSIPCPMPGSLDSLKERHAGSYRRFEKRRQGRSLTTVFRQPPKALFRTVAYDRPTARFLFELSRAEGEESFHPWPFTRVAALTTLVRDAAVARLASALPGIETMVRRVLVGQNAAEADKAQRVRLLPLPSIGHRHADSSLRRVLVEVPPDCPLAAADLGWAFAGLDLSVDPRFKEAGIGAPRLVHADDRTMLAHYGIETDASACLWHTVTPAALPVRRLAGRVRGGDRAVNEAEAGHAVRQALRHAGVAAPVAAIRVQREPFFAKGARAEAFAAASRFDAARLWHVEITFAEPVRGPLVVGDGRYGGLGLMRPVPDGFRDALILTISPVTRPPGADRSKVVRAVRRALMSRARDQHSRVATLFSGHESDDGPARSGRHRHVYLFADDGDGDGCLDQVYVIAPWLVDRSWSPSRDERQAFDQVAGSLAHVRAGPAGILKFAPARAADPGDALFAPSKTWKSHTFYRPTRHGKRHADPSQAMAEDLLRECARRGLPQPEVVVTSLTTGPRGGIVAEARLQFKIAIEGPLLLGQDAHTGGGLFTIDH